MAGKGNSTGIPTKIVWRMISSSRRCMICGSLTYPAPNRGKNSRSMFPHIEGLKSLTRWQRLSVWYKITNHPPPARWLPLMPPHGKAFAAVLSGNLSCSRILQQCKILFQLQVEPVMVLPLIHHCETVHTVAVQKHAQVDNMITHLATGLR